MLKSFLNPYFGIVVNQQIIPKLWHCSPTSCLRTSQLFYGLFRENIKILDILFLVNVQQTTYLPRKRFLKKVGPNNVDMYTNRFGNYTKAKTMLAQISCFYKLSECTEWIFRFFPKLHELWELISSFFWVLYFFTSRKNVFKVNQVCFRPGYTSNHSSSTPSVIPDLFTLSCIWEHVIVCGAFDNTCMSSDTYTIYWHKNLTTA